MGSTASAALSHNLGIAIGNILGGIAIQTVVLVALDAFGVRGKHPLTYRAASLRASPEPEVEQDAGTDDAQHGVGDLGRGHDRCQSGAGGQRPHLQPELQAQHGGQDVHTRILSGRTANRATALLR